MPSGGGSRKNVTSFPWVWVGDPPSRQQWGWEGNQAKPRSGTVLCRDLFCLPCCLSSLFSLLSHLFPLLNQSPPLHFLFSYFSSSLLFYLLFLCQLCFFLFLLSSFTSFLSFVLQSALLSTFWSSADFVKRLPL